jgi:hypothetical protein
VKVNYDDEMSDGLQFCAYRQIYFLSKNNNRGETYAIINHFYEGKYVLMQTIHSNEINFPTFLPC